MMMSHMESEGQRWPNVPNVRFGEPLDVSAAFNYGFSDELMNNLRVYDYNLLEESQNHLISGLPVQESPVYPISDPALSFSRLLANMENNRENDDPNTVKVTNFIETKVPQKSIKGPRSKRCKRTAFQSPWKQKGPDLYGSVDDQETDVSELTFKKYKGQDQETGHSETMSKKQKGRNRENNDIVCESVSVDGVGRWLEDMGFGRYASMFEMHEVDDDALPLLTLDDLKEMGIVAVGSRRKLYAAICGLKGK